MGSFAVPGKASVVESVHNESDPSEDSDEEIAGPHFFLSELIDINDRLYNFATQVRNPRTRIRPDEARRYHKGLREADVNLVDAFRSFDENHVREILLDRERGAFRDVECDVSEVSTPGPLPNPAWELAQEDEILISRLAQANTYRRQQFYRWKRNAEEAATETAKALDEDPGRPGESIGHQGAYSGVVVDIE